MRSRDYSLNSETNSFALVYRDKTFLCVPLCMLSLNIAFSQELKSQKNGTKNEKEKKEKRKQNTHKN